MACGAAAHLRRAMHEDGEDADQPFSLPEPPRRDHRSDPAVSVSDPLPLPVSTRGRCAISAFRHVTNTAAECGSVAARARYTIGRDP